MGLNTATTATQALVNGNTLYIGSSTSKVYINGNLYYSGGLIYRSSNAYSNTVSMAEYISQIKKTILTILIEQFKLLILIINHFLLYQTHI